MTASDEDHDDLSPEDYAALREGEYLLSSPANARRLLKAYENARKWVTDA